ncbi:MAG: tail fiber domain-containing protein [Bacteroidia bacterium]
MKQLLLLTALLITSNLFAQNNVGIGTTTPNTKAILELQATDKGLLTPRMNTVQMNAIVTPPNGLLVYNTDDNCFSYYNSTTSLWKSMCSATGIVNSGDTVIINIIKADTLIANYVKIDTALITNLLATYIKSDSAFIKQLITNYIQTNYIVTDSIKAGFGRFDSIYVGGQNLTQYLNSLISTKDTVVIKYLRTDSLYSTLGKFDSLVINGQSLNTVIENTIKDYLATKDTIVLKYLRADSIYAQVLRSDSAFLGIINTNTITSQTFNGGFSNMDSLYVGGQNILDIISDSINNSIATQAWLLKGNAGTNPSTNFLGTTDNKSLRIRTNNTERMIIDSIGNVGIGTNVPVNMSILGVPYLLDVRGGAVFQGRLSLTKYQQTPSANNLTWNIDNDSITKTFRIFQQPDIFTPGAEALTIDSANNIQMGIPSVGTLDHRVRVSKDLGSTAANYTLVGQHYLQLGVSRASDRKEIEIGMTDDGVGIVQSHERGVGYNTLSLNPVAGNVGIGTTTPIAKLDVNGYTVSRANVITPIYHRGNTILLASNTPTGSFVLNGTGSVTDGTMSSYIDFNNTTSYVDIDVPLAAQWGINGNNFYVSIAGWWATDLLGGTFKVEMYDGTTNTWVTLATNLNAGIHYITNPVPYTNPVLLPQLRVTPDALGIGGQARISEFEVFSTLPYGGYNFAADKIQVNTGMSFGTSAGAGMLSNNGTNFGGLSNGCNSYSLNWHNPSTATGWAGSISSNGSNGLIASTLGATAGDVPFAVTSGVYNSLLNTRTNDNLLIVKGDGSVGIGTNNPSAPLHLHSPNPNFHALRFTNENTTDHWDLVKRGQTYGAGANNNFTFAFNGAELVNIAPNGYVGILATTPIAPLHVNDIYVRPGSDGGPYDPLHASNAIFNRTLPGYNGSASEHISFAMNNQPLARMGIVANMTAGNLDAPNSIFYINTDPSVNNAWVNPKFVIQGTTGNVGIGLSGAPVAPLHVATPAIGNRVMTLQAGGLAFHYNILTTYGSFTNPDGILYVDFGGNENYMMGGTLIGDGGSGFRDLGLAVQRWNTLYCANAPDISSDMRLKTNITPVKFGLNEVTKMNPVSYNWNKENIHRGEKLHLGFLAQELKELVPTVVHEDEKGMLSVTYTELIPVLVNAIKEQQQQIDVLKTKPNNENEKIKLLEDQIQQLKQQNETILKLLQERK